MSIELYKLLKKKSAKVEMVSPDMMQYEELAPQYKNLVIPLASSDYEIGIEIEVERAARATHLITAYQGWVSKPDNSLRDNGVEFVSVPLRGWRISYALNQLYTNLPKGYRFSPRTSIHIHMNVLDLTPLQVGIICLTYGVFEKLFYKFVGGDREKNNFCVPFYDASSYNLIKYCLSDEAFLMPNLNEHRYLGLNLDSIRKFGTLEFRHLLGTDNKATILRWINLLFCLKTWAKNTSWIAFRHRLDRLNTTSDYSVLLQDVFGEHGRVLDSSSLQQDMERLVSSVKKVNLEPNKFMESVKKMNPHSSYWFSVQTKKSKKSTNTWTMEFTPAPRELRRPPRVGRVPEPALRREPLFDEDVEDGGVPDPFAVVQAQINNLNEAAAQAAQPGAYIRIRNPNDRGNW